MGEEGNSFSPYFKKEKRIRVLIGKEKNMEFTREYGLEKGYLQNRKVILKPIPRGGTMITDPSHSGYFMWEGASKQFCLASNRDTNELVSPFKNEEEMKYFSGIVDQDLNVYKKKDNFWHNFYVKVTKDHKLMNQGITYDLANPMDNLRYRVLMQQAEVAESWDRRYARTTYKFAFVNEDHEEEVNTQKMDKQAAIWTFWGSIKSSPKKMREFLGTYLMEKKVLKNVPVDATKEFLTTEINKIIENDPDLMYKIIEDPERDLKYWIFRAIQTGAIVRKGVATYELTGENVDYNYKELIDHIKFLKENTDPLYQKIEAQLNTKK